MRRLLLLSNSTNHGEGYLDHAMANPDMLAQVSSVAEWHINADEPNVLDYNTDFKSAGQIISLYAPDEFRMSDHDVVLVDLDLEGSGTPACTSATPSRTVLWPPTGGFSSIRVSTVNGSSSRNFTILITSIFQDEPVGQTSPDGLGVGTSVAHIRAERDLGGNGRVYHIGFTAEDSGGNLCSGTVKVGVPITRRGAPAVDDGALYDSTLP